MYKTKFQFLTGMLLAFSIVQGIEIGFSDRQISTSQINTFKINTFQDQQAEAKSSAGRSGGGSFTRSSPSKPSSSSTSKSTPPSTPDSSTPSRSTDRESLTPNNQRSGGNSVIVIPNSGYTSPNSSNSLQSNPNNSSSTSSSSTSWIVGLIILLIIFAVMYLIIWAIFLRPKKNQALLGLGNDTFTISKLQVALLAQAREVQARLTELSLDVDTDTPEGLMTLMQEAAIALLRTPENWTHVLASSQPVARDKAEQVFNQMLLEERTKFSEETLVNLRGRVAVKPEAIAPTDEDPAAYIVVTLLIGTEHDQPLFGEIKNIQELTKALEAIAVIPASHLLVFELMWSPQAETDSLTYDELLTEYSNMIQI